MSAPESRGPRYWIETWGCQMNVHDSEKLAGALEQAGYSRAGRAEEANVILLNTCSIRDKAAEKVFSELGRLRELKRANPELVLVVAGCVAQQGGEELFKRAPFVDAVLGPRATASLVPTLSGLRGGDPAARRTVDVEYREDSIRFPFDRIRRESSKSTRRRKRPRPPRRKSLRSNRRWQHYRQIAGLDQEIERGETDYAAIDARLKENDGQISEIKDRREKTLEQFRLLELEQAQRKLKREHIAGQLEDRYQTPFAELSAQVAAAGEDDAAPDLAGREAELSRLRTKIARIGDVNLGAIKEYQQLHERHDFLQAQKEDLEKGDRGPAPGDPQDQHGLPGA